MGLFELKGLKMKAFEDFQATILLILRTICRGRTLQMAIHNWEKNLQHKQDRFNSWQQALLLQLIAENVKTFQSFSQPHNK